MRAARSPATGRDAVVALAGVAGAAESDVARVLRARGLISERATGTRLDTAIDDAIARGVQVVAVSLAEAPDAATAAELAGACRGAAEVGRPLVLLVPVHRGGGKAAIERAAALAHLRAHGAVLVSDPDAWIESIVLLARWGLPAGPRTAVIAPTGSWLEASARAQAIESEASGSRGPAVAAVAADVEPADVVLVDHSVADDVPAARTARALVVPVVPRGELLMETDEQRESDGVGALSALPTGRGRSPLGMTALVGLRAALAAVAACGRAAERMAAGLGPAPLTARAELEVDEERLRRQLDKLTGSDRRIGDHEAKVLLAAYGVPVTRQAVATTPSAATRIAKKAGYPVEIKPWGHDVPSERTGCPVERGVDTASEVRRAFLAVLGAAGLPVAEADGAAVIVRETPPAGREVSASFLRVGPLGWTVIVEIAGAGPLAAPAPLRLLDATALAAAVTASRAGDAEPDRIALANLLRRTSHLVCDHDARFDRIELGRLVVTAKGGRTLVIDAEILLR